MQMIKREFNVRVWGAGLVIILIVALVLLALGDTNDSLAGTVALQGATSNVDITAFVAKVNATRSTPFTISSLLTTAAQNRANDRAGGNTSVALATYLSNVNYMATASSGTNLTSSSNLSTDSLYTNATKATTNFASTSYTQIGIGIQQASGGTWHYVFIFAKPVVLTAPGATIDNVGTGASQEQDIVNLVNAARAAAGLCPLVINPQLTAAAQRQANDMSTNNFLEHTGTDGSDVWKRIADTGYPATYAGENILARANIHAAAAFDQWWNSPPHHDNMMNPNFLEVGIAWAGPKNSKYHYAMVLAAKGGGGCTELQQQQQLQPSGGGGTTTGGTTTGGTTTGGTEEPPNP
jgi:uncharacterized protein YkwD